MLSVAELLAYREAGLTVICTDLLLAKAMAANWCGGTGLAVPTSVELPEDES